MRKVLFIALLTLFALPAYSQLIGTVPSPEKGMTQNSVSNMGAFGDTLWIGPKLNYNIDNGHDWLIPEQADSIVDGRGRVFSLALAQDTVWVGSGFNKPTDNGSVQTQQGLLSSFDGGSQWDFISPEQTLDAQEDTLLSYGGQEIDALPVVVPEQSPPFNVDFHGDTVFMSAWASGIRRSQDGGETWQRIVLPPKEMDELDPDSGEDFDFKMDPNQPGDGHPNQQNYPRGYLNFLGFSVKIDDDGYVWAGTAGGLNVSDNALTADKDQIRWRNINHGTSRDDMFGNWVTHINQNSYDGRVWITNWISTDQDERYGVVATSDKGETFDRYLVDEQIYAVEFDGETIYAAGDNGLFISKNNGASWIQHERLESPNTFIKETADYFDVAHTNDRLWVGTSDGLASTDDQGESWEIRRVNFPLDGENQHQSTAPDVDSYAYPNPFSMRAHEITRIKFEVEETSSVKIRLYDFAMNPIRELDDISSVEPGTYEAAWDGTDEQGRNVANGTVFYRIEAGDQEITGKILVLE